MARPPLGGGPAGGARVLPGCWRAWVPLRRCLARGLASPFVQRDRGLAEVRPHLSSFGFWGEGLQAARGCGRAPRAVAWGAILAEFGLHGALRKEKNGVRRGSCSGVTGIFELGDIALLKHLVSFLLATCWLLLVWGVHCLSGSLSSFKVEGGKRQTAPGEISGGRAGGRGGAEARWTRQPGRFAPNL